MKVIVTGGGTGGHINPAIAIAQEIKEMDPHGEVLYVGAENGMESDLATRSGFPFKAIAVKGFRRKLTLDTLKTALVLIKGLLQANALIRREKPDVVIGTGGYVCGPVVLLGALHGCATLIHEQNAIPGVTNRILSRFVDVVCTSYPDSGHGFNKAKRTVLTGNPVRREFVGLEKSQCRESLGLDAKDFVVVSTGGSGGARAINSAVKEVLKKKLPTDMFWYHITGKNYYTEFMDADESDTDPKKWKAVPFSHEMPLLLGAADVVVSRSGALIIAEISAAGVSSILIPSPNVANNHQDFNALECEKTGMSKILWEKDLNGDTLWASIMNMKESPDLLNGMKYSAKKMYKASATASIIREVKDLFQTKQQLKRQV